MGSARFAPPAFPFTLVSVGFNDLPAQNPLSTQEFISWNNIENLLCSL